MKFPSIFIAILLFAFIPRSFGQVILAPDLQCVRNDATNGDISLSWTNPPTNPCGPFVQYIIYGSSQGINGPYSQVATVTNQATSTFILNGLLSISPDWHFYMEANYNCPGATVLQSDTVDNKNPITPLIVNVDVTPGNDVVFNWEASPSPQTQFYIIYYYLNGVVTPADTVYGRFNTTWTDVVADPTLASLYYTVAAVDSCGSSLGTSAFNTEPHNTILLESSTTACQNQIDLSWNAYNNWPIGVKRYEIWGRINQAPFNQVASVDSSVTDYAFTGFADGDSVCLFVRAIDALDTTVVSNSNIVCMEASIVQPPSFIYMTNATVMSDSKISITWITDPTAELTFNKIERSGNNTSFMLVEQLSAPAPTPFTQTYEDSFGVIPAKNPYYYRVVAFDSCQTQYPTPSVKTMCLRGELYDYYVANVYWNDFELQGATVTSYRLYRNNGTGYQLLRTFPFGVTEYSDSLHAFLYDEGTFCYRIEAVYDISLPDAGYQATLSSWSNELCIIHRPIIYIPNAFAPNGLNNIFKPTIIFGGPRAYTLQIYNRYGGKVFESNDPAVGWDGTDHGKEAQQGGYAYLIQFIANDDVKVERKGMVLLVR